MEIMRSNELNEKLNIQPRSKSDIGKCLDRAKKDAYAKQKFIEDNRLVYNKKENVYDCHGDVTVEEEHLTQNGIIPVKLGHVLGNFFCYNTSIKSLTNSPARVNGGFNCHECKNLKSLKGAPIYVGKDFDCVKCENLESLEGAPEYVGLAFMCHSCTSLKNLMGAPEYVGGTFTCGGCTNLETLEGAPQKVGGDFACHECGKLTSLKGAPEYVGKDLFVRDCDNLETLEGAPEYVSETFYCLFCKKLAIDTEHFYSKMPKHIKEIRIKDLKFGRFVTRIAKKYSKFISVYEH